MMVRPSARLKRLQFEKLEQRFVCDSGIGIQINVGSQVLGQDVSPQFPLNSELEFDIQVANQSQQIYNDLAMNLRLGSQAAITALPVLVPSVVQGTQTATFPMGALRFLSHPTEPIVFATIPSTNSLAVFNTETLMLQANFFVGSRPYGMTLSNDGNLLYVANSTSQILSVVDWRAKRVTQSITLSAPAQDIEVGADGRLYVLTNRSLIQIDPNNGRKVGPDFSVLVRAGELAISPNKDRLYYGDYGISTASLYQWDISVQPPTLLWESDDGITSGAYGEDLAMSANGTFISFATSSGQIGYNIAKYRTSDMAILGTFDTGPFPQEITFSPDGLQAYAIHSEGEIDVFDTTTFLLASTFRANTRKGPYELLIDSKGRSLFVSDSSAITVYATGLGSTLVNVGDLNQNGKLDPLETWQYKAMGTARPALQSVEAYGTIRGAIGGLLAIGATGSYTGIASPEIKMFVKGVDSTSPTKPKALVGQEIQYSFTLSNPYSAHFGNVGITLDNGTPNDPTDDLAATLVSGDTNRDGLLGFGEVWRMNIRGVAKIDFVNVSATLLADLTDGSGSKLVGQVPARVNMQGGYFGAFPEVRIRSVTEGLESSATDVLFAEVGSDLTSSLYVTNTGNVVLNEVQVEDRSSTDEPFAFQPVLGPPTKRGDLLASYPEFKGRVKFLIDPSRSVVYVSVFDKNLIAILDTKSLQVLGRISVGAGPSQMTLSRDNQTLYIASSVSRQITRVDLRTRNLLTPFVLSDWVYDVKVGADRLYVLTSRALFGMNETTGQVIGEVITQYAGGEIAISPDRKQLYYGVFARSPAELLKYSLDGDAITRIDSRSDEAQSGQDLAISHDGEFVAFAAGAGQFGYQIAQYRTRDMTIVGSFATGPYPTEIVYGPDDRIAYTVHATAEIQAWDTSTFGQLYSIPTIDSATEMEVSQDGAVLIAAFEDSLRVYDLAKGLIKNIGDVDRDNQLDVGETWQYTNTSFAKVGLHKHETTLKSFYPELVFQHTVSTTTVYEGVSDGSVVLEFVRGARIMPLESNTVYFSDDRFEFKNGSIFLKDEHFLTMSDNALQLNVTYADQTSRVVNVYVRSNKFPWHNWRNASDIDGDMKVTPLDVLSTINELNHRGTRWLSTRHYEESIFYDVDEDGSISPLDVLVIINEINRKSASNGEGEQSDLESDNWMIDLDTVEVDQYAVKLRRRMDGFRSVAR
jgi:YVTN family beta-propeller protein